MTNREIVEWLRKVAACYQILRESRFKIIAYERAADSIEHLTSEVKDYWDDKKLDQIPGVGTAIAGHLDELLRTGRVSHWNAVLARVPEAVFPLLSIPGIGPKKAYALVTKLKLHSAKTAVSKLEEAAKKGTIAPIPGFGKRSQDVIFEGIGTYKKGAVKQYRMPLAVADTIARDVIAFLKKSPVVVRADVLGSLRRKVATVGDIDIAVATKKPEEAISHVKQYPHEKIIESGPGGVTLLLVNGRQVDVRVEHPVSYGAMLQYFTGSKNHNVKLRAYALQKGLSLSEHGIKTVKDGRMRSFQTEEAFYGALGFECPAPEIREDRGEIEALATHTLPKLVSLSSIRGDLHVHTNYDLSSSHDIGRNTVSEMFTKAAVLGYEYVGISDHNPAVGKNSVDKIVSIMRKRKEYYEREYRAWRRSAKRNVRYFLMCEVDILPDGKLALPEAAFSYVDAVIISIHSSFRQDRETVTDRIVHALHAHPKVRIFGHPTGRLLQEREGVDADWGTVFKAVKETDTALEINAYPSRLDLPDTLVRDAVRYGVKLVVNTDSHAVENMDYMRYGVSVARRGWAGTRDIVNTLGYNEIRRWLLTV